MKRFLAIALCMLFAFSVLMTGCSAPASKSNLILATGGTSGTYYPYGGAMAQIFNTNIKGMNVTAQATGASAENLRLVNKKEADIAIVQNDVMDHAYKGIETFPNEKLENIRTLATLYPEIIQIVVSPDSGIKTIADMKGKKISVGAAGSGVEANAKQILEAYNLKFEDIQVRRLSFAESASAYKDKQIDGFFVTAGIPNTAIQEITASQPIKIISMDDASISKLTQKYPFYTQYTIKKDAYKGMDADAKTVAVKATLIVNKELSNDLVYNLTKTLFEKKTELGQAHAKGNELDINEAVKGVSVPFHPGAEKYFKEKGLMK